jgi:hypothetical protein
MKRFIIFFLVFIGFYHHAQTILLKSNYASESVTDVIYDTLNNKNYFCYSSGYCGGWGTTSNCKLINQSSSVFGVLSLFANSINKFNYTDDLLITQLKNNQISYGPVQSVSSFSAAYCQKAIKEGPSIYTNLGFMFHKVDTTLLTTVWSYSISNGAREISTFEHRNDSIFLFEKDSTALINYYTLSVKSKLTGASIPYSSLLISNPNNSKGAIIGKIFNSYLLGNKIIISGVFSASVSGVQVCNNLAVIDIPTGQLSAPPTSFLSSSKIYDLEFANNKFYLAGNFTSVNATNIRYNMAVLDNNLNLLSDTVNIRGIGSPTTIFVDDITFYDNVLLTKGNFNSINSTTLSAVNTYSARAFNTSLNSLLPYSLNTPTATPITMNDWLFKTVKNKLYMNRFLGSGFYIYCLPPSQFSQNIVSNSNSGINTASVCVPGILGVNTFTAPFRNAISYTWLYSGTGVTLTPLATSSVISFVASASATSGTLSVFATNDCGSNSPTVQIAITVKSKPSYIVPQSPQFLLCNPDSTQLFGSTINTNASLFWRKQSTSNYSTQPVYVKSTGNYYLIAKDIANGCSDSSSIIVNTNYNTPNSKLISHTYLGPVTAIDTVTCLKPTVTITGASDTSGVTFAWRNILTNSLTANPINLIGQANLKLIVTKTSNGCADSSLIALVSQNNAPINYSLSANAYSINCSVYTATLNAIGTASDNVTVWSGSNLTNATNPAITNNTGTYTVISTNTLSGCSSTKTVNVNYSNVLNINSSNDTLVCKNSNITISAIALGTISPITYSWSNGGANAVNQISINNTSTYIVTANGGGCIGYDTVIVNIAPPINDSIVSYKACSNPTVGSIVLFVNSGLAPFQYSINNGLTFFASNSFTNQAFGTYTTVIKDALGCTKSNTVALNAFSNLPVPKFIASTLNTQNDTIVLVDISVPKPDSVQWILPINVIKIGGNMFNPVIVVSDTGSFSVTMRAFYGNCIINTTKLIKFGQVDTLQANNYNANGVKSVLLFPNPNTGQFTIDVEFYKKQNASVQVLGSSGVQYFQQNMYDTLLFSMPINLTQLNNDTYILRVIGEYDTKNVSFIISK